MKHLLLDTPTLPPVQVEAPKEKPRRTYKWLYFYTAIGMVCFVIFLIILLAFMGAGRRAPRPAPKKVQITAIISPPNNRICLV